MKKSMENARFISMQLVVRDNCSTCQKVWRDLEDFSRLQKTISLELLNLDKSDKLPDGGQSHLTPALWVNRELWYLGDFDWVRFEKRIAQVLNSRKGF